MVSEPIELKLGVQILPHLAKKLFETHRYDKAPPPVVKSNLTYPMLLTASRVLSLLRFMPIVPKLQPLEGYIDSQTSVQRFSNDQ